MLIQQDVVNAALALNIGGEPTEIRRRPEAPEAEQNIGETGTRWMGTENSINRGTQQNHQLFCQSS